jgi:hypothetical protein
MSKHVPEDTKSAKYKKSEYNLIMFLSGLSQIKRRIMVALAHLYPRAVSGKQLTDLIGLSGKAGSLYRGILTELEKEEMILIDRLTPRISSIRVNHEHPLLHHLVALCKECGTPLTSSFTQILEGTKERT